jgi:hypothetical protein
VFLHPVRSTGHIVHSGAPGSETSTDCFSCSGGPGGVSVKMHTATCYAEHVFLHLVGSAGHVVHSGASMP